MEPEKNTNATPSIEPHQSVTQHATSKPHKINLLRNKIFLAFVALLLVGVPTTVFMVTQQQITDSKASIISKTVPTAAPSINLAIQSPTDQTLVTNALLPIVGTTLPDSTVVFYSDFDQNSVQSDSSGKFEGTLKLSSGINTITVTAFSDQDQEKSVTFDVVYNQ